MGDMRTKTSRTAAPDADADPRSVAEVPQRPVLIVDDDPDILFTSRLLLERNGFAVETRTHCPDWTELSALHPSVVFMDINLGVENGMQACAAIKRNPRLFNLPVILISGMDDVRLADAAAECHADGFLTKPYGSSLLVDLARHYAQPPGPTVN